MSDQEYKPTPDHDYRAKREEREKSYEEEIQREREARRLKDEAQTYSQKLCDKINECGKCGEADLKLWMHTLHHWLLCAQCLVPEKLVDKDGTIPCKLAGRTQFIAGYNTDWVPAVPVNLTRPDNWISGFWRYLNVPAERMEWWQELPTYNKKEEKMEAEKAVMSVQGTVTVEIDFTFVLGVSPELTLAELRESAEENARTKVAAMLGDNYRMLQVQGFRNLDLLALKLSE